MKIRNGFVTNSSSSSFVVNKKDLSKKQIKAIKNHTYHAWKKFMWRYIPNDVWEITETSDIIRGYTPMDNFDMIKFMEEIGVDIGSVEFKF